MFVTKEAWVRRGQGVFCSRDCIRARENESRWWTRNGQPRLEIDMDSILDLYTSKGLGTVEIAKLFGTSSGTINSRLKMAGIRIRTNKEAQQLRSAQGKSKAENHPLWNGGKKFDRGYVQIHRPNHHRADTKGYVREHILVWEETTGKKIKDGMVIHHLNGIKDDNRPENLFAMSNSGHSKREQGEHFKCRIRELEAEAKELKDRLSQILTINPLN